MAEWATADRGTLGKLKRLTGAEERFCHPIQWHDGVDSLGTDDLGGVLLKIIPYQESEGVRSGVEMLRSLHEEATRDINSFEIWFEQGEIHFYIYAANEDAAEKVRRKVRGSYPDAQVVTVESGMAFPHIDPDEYVAGSRIVKEDPIQYLPVRRYDDDEWEHDDPYTQVLGSMISTDETRVVIQGVMRAVPKAWTNGDGSPDGASAAGKARDLRAGGVTGWIPGATIREYEPTKTDEIRAGILEEQARKPAFEVNLRVLAISPSPEEAANRAQDVSSSYSTYYDTRARQGLKPYPVTAVAETFQRTKMKRHINDMRYRSVEPKQSCIMTFKELGGVCHIPSGDIPTQYIEWKRTRSGGEIPRGAPGKVEFK